MVSIERLKRQSVAQVHTFPKLPWAEDVIRRMAVCAYFLIGYDLFAIYKGHYKYRARSRYHIYLRPELRMFAGTVDKWRHRLKMFSFVVYVIFLCRFIVICLVQLAKYQATSFVEYKNGDPVHYSVPIMTDTRLIKLLRQYKLYDLFDNALSDFPSVSLTIYICMMTSVTYLMLYIPYKHTREPVDGINLRIGLNPEQERKRAMLTIKERMEQLLLVSETYKLSIPLVYKSRLPIECSTMSTLGPTDKRLQQKQYTDREMIFETACLQQRCTEGRQVNFVFDDQMLSIRYSAEYPAFTWRLAFFVTLVVILLSLPFGIILQLQLTEMATNMKCKIRKLSDCSTSNALTFYEIYSLTEMCASMYVYGVTFCISAISILMHSHSQFVIIEETKTDLNDLLCALRLINKSHCTFSFAKNRSHMNCIRLAGKESHLEDALAKMLVKTRISLDEFKSQARFISQQVSSYVFFVGISLVLALTTGKMDGPDMLDLRGDVIRFLWIAANMMLILCSSQYAKMIALQKTGWSILAQLYTRITLMTSQANIVGREQACLDPHITGWLRLVEEGCLCEIANSIRPFGVSMTFRQVLQLNFYVTSLAALVFR